MIYIHYFWSVDEKINKIKEVLVRKGVSQKELATHLEKNEHTVSNWCINKSQPHLKELQRVADFLDVDICELLISNKDR
jgi:putative transcriptional regulator